MNSEHPQQHLGGFSGPQLAACRASWPNLGGGRRVLGNLTTNVAGTATLGSTVIRTFQKALATGSGNVSEICTITGSNLTFAGHLYVVQAETGKACLTYSLCVSAQNGSGGTTNGAWHRQPVSMGQNNW